MQNVSKRTILWIVPILIIAIFWYYYGPQDEITDNEYITYIKDTSFSENGEKTLDNAFSNFCNEGKWVYFKTQKNQNVVEFKGACPVEEKESKVNLQFIVEDDQTEYQVGVLLLDGVQQTEEKRDEFLKMIVTN